GISGRVATTVREPSAPLCRGLWLPDVRSIRVMTNEIADPLVEVPEVSATSDLVHIAATVSGAVTVTMNRPRRRNAFDADLISALEEAFRTLAGAAGARV